MAMEPSEQSPEQPPEETPDQPETPAQPSPPRTQQNSQTRLFRLPSLTPKERGRLLWMLGGVIAVVLISCIVGAVVLAVSSKNALSNTASNPAASATTAPTSAPTQQGVKHHQVGDTIITAAWQVTINSASAYAGNPFQFETPRAGDTFLVIQGTFKNLTNQAQPLSTLLFFTLQDTQGNSYPEAVLNSVRSPDSPVLASGDTQGEWGYEVPASIHTFILIFSDDLGHTTFVWDISI